MRLKTSGKIIIFLLVVGVAFGAYRMFGGNLASLLPGKETTSSVVPPKVELPTGEMGSTSTLELRTCRCRAAIKPTSADPRYVSSTGHGMPRWVRFSPTGARKQPREA